MLKAPKSGRYLLVEPILCKNPGKALAENSAAAAPAYVVTSILLLGNRLRKYDFKPILNCTMI